MNDDDADPQTAQNCDVQEQFGEVVVGNDGPIQRDDEHFVPEMRDVAEDLAKISEPLHDFVPSP
jgi:hypothetical protein